MGWFLASEKAREIGMRYYDLGTSERSCSRRYGGGVSVLGRGLCPGEGSLSWEGPLGSCSVNGICVDGSDQGPVREVELVR